MNRMFGMICICLLFFGILSVRASAAYVIGEQDGCLVIEHTDEQTSERTAVRTNLLPRSDRERLRRGIVCKTRTELAARLEELCS